MNSLGSLVTVVVAGVIAMVGAGALIARKLNGHNGGCPIPEHVAMLAKHDKAIEIIQQDLAEIKATLGHVRDMVIALRGEHKTR